MIPDYIFITIWKMIFYLFYLLSLSIQNRNFLFIRSSFSFTLCKKNRQPQITPTLTQNIGKKLKSFKIIELTHNEKRNQFGMLVANIGRVRRYF